MGGQLHAPGALPLGKTQYILYRRLGGSHGRSGQVRKISPPPGFDPRTVQPVASHYTDWAIPIPTTEINNGVFAPYLSYAYTAVLLSLGSSGTQHNDVVQRVVADTEERARLYPRDGSNTDWNYSNKDTAPYPRRQIIKFFDHHWTKKWTGYFQRNSRIVWGISGIYRCILNTV